MNIEGFLTILAWFVCFWTTAWLSLMVAGAIVGVREGLQLQFGSMGMWSFLISWAWLLSR